MNGTGETLGYRVMNQKLRMEHDIKVPQDLVYTAMQKLDDNGSKSKPIGVNFTSKGFLEPIL